MAGSSTYNINKTIVSRYQWGKPSAAALKDAAKNAKLNGLKPEQLAVYNAIVGLFKGLEVDLYGNNRDKKSRYTFNFLVSTLLQRISEMDMSSSQAEAIQEMLDAQTAGQKKALEAAIQDLASSLDKSGNSDASSVESFTKQFVTALKDATSQNDEFGKFLEQKLSTAVQSALEDTVKDSDVQSKLGKTLIDEVRKELGSSSSSKTQQETIGFDLSDINKEEKKQLLTKIKDIQSSLDAQQRLSVKNFLSLGKMSTQQFDLLNPTASNTEVVLYMTSRIMNKVGEALKKIGSGLWDAVTFPFKLFNNFVIAPMLKGVWGLVSVPFKFIGNMLSNVWSSLKDGIWNTLKTFIKSPAGIAVLAYGAGYIWGRWLKPVYIKYIEPVIDWITDKAIKVLSNIWDWCKDTLWPWFRDDVWPFLKKDVWPWFRDDLWPWLKEAWGWCKDKLWPWLKDTVIPLCEDIGHFLGIDDPTCATLTGVLASFLTVDLIVSFLPAVFAAPVVVAALGVAIAAALGKDKVRGALGTAVRTGLGLTRYAAEGAKGAPALANAMKIKDLKNLGFEVEKMSKTGVRLAEESAKAFHAAESLEAAGAPAAEIEKALARAVELEKEAKNAKTLGWFGRSKGWISRTTKNFGAKIYGSNASKSAAKFFTKHAYLGKTAKFLGKAAPGIGASIGLGEMAFARLDQINIKKQMLGKDGKIDEIKANDLDDEMGHADREMLYSVMDTLGGAAGYIPVYGSMIQLASTAATAAARAVDNQTAKMEQETKAYLKDMTAINSIKGTLPDLKKTMQDLKNGNQDILEKRLTNYNEIKDKVNELIKTRDDAAKFVGEAGAWSTWTGKTAEMAKKGEAARAELQQLLAKSGFTSDRDFKSFYTQNKDILDKIAEEKKQQEEEEKAAKEKEERQLKIQEDWSNKFNQFGDSFESVNAKLDKILQTKPTGGSSFIFNGGGNPSSTFLTPSIQPAIYP